MKIEAREAFLWSTLERFGQQGIQFIISIVLARILLPTDYGLIAMVAVILAIANAFVNSGFSQALIQKKVISREDTSSMFYFNMAVSILVTIIILFTADFISIYFQEPALVPIIKVLSITIPINAFGQVQRTLIKRQLNFKTQFRVTTVATLISGAVAIFMAIDGKGVWSLVVFHVLGETLNSILFWHYSEWRPSLLFNTVSLASMYKYGSSLFAVSLSNAFFVNIYQIIIGRYYNAQLLGYYSRANTVQKMPITIINSIVTQVTFPMFSRVQENKSDLLKYAKKINTMIMFITFPIMFGLIAIAEPLVVVMLTDKWLPVVPYLQLLCISGMIQPMLAINLNILNAQGYSNLYLKIDTLNKVTVILFVIFTYKHGILIMIMGYTFNSLLTLFIFSFYSGKHINYSIISQLRDVAPFSIISIAMMTAVYIVTYLPINSEFVLLLLQIIVGMFFYTLVAYIFAYEQLSYLLSYLKR